MKVNLDKTDLVNLVTSVQPDSMTQCDSYTKQGLMKFSGNQWNESWSWVHSELLKMSDTKLFSLYKKHK